VRADLLARLDRTGEAVTAYHKVLALAPFPSERRWIERKLAHLESAASSQ
jgi:predicted RNA polymerase sigma factor